MSWRSSLCGLACLALSGGVTGPAPAAAQVAFLGVDEKCSACKAIVYELDRAMRFEQPQEKIKLGRQVLDSRGDKRAGREIDYKKSELRAITIIDSLCPTMQHYGKVVKDGESRWMRVNYAEGDVVIDGSMTLGGQKSTTEGKALKLYCDRVVEENEDDWVEATREGVDDLENRVCGKMLRLCGDEAVKAEKEREAQERRIKLKHKKKALTPQQKRLQHKIKKVDQLRKDVKRATRIKLEKMRAKDKLVKDIARYKKEVAKFKEDLEAAEKALEEEEAKAEGKGEL
jgi:hypothetical protein